MMTARSPVESHIIRRKIVDKKLETSLTPRAMSFGKKVPTHDVSTHVFDAVVENPKKPLPEPPAYRFGRVPMIRSITPSITKYNPTAEALPVAGEKGNARFRHTKYPNTLTGVMAAEKPATGNGYKVVAPFSTD
jgi:hypothetical protein